MKKHSRFIPLALLGLPLAGSAVPAEMPAPRPLEGTWTLVYADVLHADGTRGHDYGDAPKGLLQIDRSGHYSLLIFDTTRPKFAAGDKSKGTAEEFRAAALGTSSHFGTVNIDVAAGTLAFHIEGATYPNWENTTQVRKYELSGDLLSYKVPPRANGDVPVSGWKRLGS
ncbi:lipocalin-like domain-containing protein [Rudaea sp.]|uniref:lipocalin-like domain-containing protein n=1 Tax=Rudaea sp. TaxID=2136325 RepID=UPI002ED69314